jgi:hypothetical protein
MTMTMGEMLVEQRLGTPEIAKRRRECRPMRGKRKLILQRKAKAVAKSVQVGMHVAGLTGEAQELRPPVDVLADRERRLGIVPETLGQALLGDPMPGRSALDKRRAMAE